MHAKRMDKHTVGYLPMQYYKGTRMSRLRLHTASRYLSDIMSRKKARQNIHNAFWFLYILFRAGKTKLCCISSQMWVVKSKKSKEIMTMKVRGVVLSGKRERRAREGAL